MLVFHILDPQELHFEFTEMVEFKDMECGETLLLEAERAKTPYLENFERLQERLRKESGLLGIDYVLLETSRPLAHALFNYLSSRAGRGGYR